MVAVGLVRKRQAVNFRIFGKIFFAWFVTVPISAFFGAASFAILKVLLLDNYADQNPDRLCFNTTEVRVTARSEISGKNPNNFFEIEKKILKWKKILKSKKNIEIKNF